MWSGVKWWRRPTGPNFRRLIGYGRRRLDTRGSCGPAFDHALLLSAACPPPRSATMYFWAKTGDTREMTSPRLTGIDGDHNICFAIRGTAAWLQKRNLVSCPIVPGVVAPAADVNVEAHEWKLLSALQTVRYAVAFLFATAP